MIWEALSGQAAFILFLALLADARFGEPSVIWSRAPHPAALMGRLISALERALNRGGWRRLKGALAVLVLLIAALGVGAGLQAIPVLGPVLAGLAAAILIAHKSLTEHVRAVADGLDQSLEEGRRAVSMIVGRDPESLDGEGVSRAAIESCAENFSDGVAAPAFWFLIAGAPGIIAYKIVNTADSMIGHRTPRHEAFGWASARLDDLLNLIPARLSGLLIALASPAPWRAARAMRRDAHRHASPNAGWPEAAMAGGLDVALAGPRRYGGAVLSAPYLHAAGRRAVGSLDIRLAAAIVDRAWLALTVFVAGAAVAETLGGL